MLCCNRLFVPIWLCNLSTPVSLSLSLSLSPSQKCSCIKNNSSFTNWSVLFCSFQMMLSLNWWSSFNRHIYLNIVDLNTANNYNNTRNTHFSAAKYGWRRGKKRICPEANGTQNYPIKYGFALFEAQQKKHHTNHSWTDRTRWENAKKKTQQQKEERVRKKNLVCFYYFQQTFFV